MRGLLPVAGLRLREAFAGRILWLLPLHFALALAAAMSMPGPGPEARAEAADAAALGLAALLGLAAAALLGAGPLADERERARGTVVLASPAGALARVLGTALGTGTALGILVLGLLASALAAVDLGVGAQAPPHRWVRTGDLPDDDRMVWVDSRGSVEFFFPVSAEKAAGATLEIEARPRLAAGGGLPGRKQAVVVFRGGTGGERRVTLSAPLTAPFRATVPADVNGIGMRAVEGNLDLGIRSSGVRLDLGPRPRVTARGLHAAALGAGLLAAMAAALAISTVAGGGVSAAGAFALALLSLFRSTFADAASMLGHAGAMQRALEEAHGGHVHGTDLTGTPPAMAPLFRALSALLPDGTRFDLSAAVAAGEVPDSGDAAGAVLAGLLAAALFLGLAVLGARRRP